MPTYSAVTRKQAGFTYFGVLILIAALGVTTAAALTLGASVQRRVDEEELLFIGAQYRAAIESYYRASPVGSPHYPMSLQDLLRDPRYPNLIRHLRQLYPDPMTAEVDWVLVPAPEGGIMGVHSASTHTPVKVGNFPPPFQVFEGKESYAEWVFFFSGVASLPASYVISRPSPP
jgi:type II secretory pathway pseudopilin PulG